MARRFVTTARFNPYRYDELAAPVQRATVLLSQQASALAQTEAQNAALEKYLDPELDGEAYDLYKQNEAKLRRGVEMLSKQGLNNNTFNLLRDASTTYSRDIAPMQNAVVLRAQFNAKIADMLSSNPDTAIKGGYKRGLSEFYNGIPEIQMVSGKSIQKDVSDMASLLAQAKAVSMTRERWSAYQDLIRKQYGYSLPELEVAKQPGSPEYIMMEQILQKHGVIDGNGNNLMDNQTDFDKMLSYAKEGLNSLLGKNDADIRANDLDKIQENAYRWASLNGRASKSSGNSGKGSGSEKKDDDWNVGHIDYRPIEYKSKDNRVSRIQEPYLLLQTENITGRANALANLLQSHGYSKQGTLEIRNARGVAISFHRGKPGDKTSNRTFDITVYNTNGTPTKYEGISPEYFGIPVEDFNELIDIRSDRGVGNVYDLHTDSPQEMTVYEESAINDRMRIILENIRSEIQLHYKP